MKAELNENEVIVVGHIDHDNYEEYIGKTVKVMRSVYLSRLGLTKIPINFTEVGGGFYCDNNELTDLIGAPRKVGRSFDCACNDLTDLIGAPKEVGCSFYCYENKLTSLEGAPEKVGRDFYCSDNLLTDLEGAPTKVGRDFNCSYNPLLRSHKGKPAFIGGKFRE